MLAVLAGLLLAAVLLVFAALKGADFAGTRAALATYGITSPAGTRAAWAGLIAVEVALAPAVAAGLRPAAWAAAALFGLFAAAQGIALAAGRAGAPCACLGARGRLGPRSLARAIALGVTSAAVALAPREALTTQTWLAIGLAVALLGLVALTVVVLALAREIGGLRLALTPQGALEVPHEGPEVGGRSALVDCFAAPPALGRLGLAVFTSEGCALCRALAPVVAAFGRNPHVALQTFDEVEDARAWKAADVPGSPYAVAFDADGTVLAKGTFNSGAQLESVLATAERRRAGRAPAPTPTDAPR